MKKFYFIINVPIATKTIPQYVEAAEMLSVMAENRGNAFDKVYEHCNQIYGGNHNSGKYLVQQIGKPSFDLIAFENKTLQITEL
jgi:hypothetical protein